MFSSFQCYFYLSCYFFVGSVTGSLASEEELAVGLRIGYAGLGMPAPPPPAVEPSPQPTGLNLEAPTCELRGLRVFLKKPILTSFFISSAAIPDDILAGWIESLGKVHTIIRGYLASVSFVSFLVCSWVSCFCGTFRSFLRGLEEGGLLEASPCAAGAPEPGECTSSLFFGDSLVCFVAASVLLSEEVLVFQGHHMAMAMEERTTTEMLGWNNAVETLKREVEVLGDENTMLSTEVTRLSAKASEVADLLLKVASFRDDKERAEG
jgi:hypothetical protein